jgi:uncharacterized protein (TIGR02246 family)
VSTRDVVEAWLRYFNAGDSAGIATLYAEDAVNHQVALAPIKGREAIEKMHRDTFAGGPLTCIPVNIVAEGEWVALEWTDPEGFRGCGFFHVVDGLIVPQRG